MATNDKAGADAAPKKMTMDWHNDEDDDDYDEEDNEIEIGSSKPQVQRKTAAAATPSDASNPVVGSSSEQKNARNV